MSRYSMIPPNFVTLRHLKELKEKREEEERLKKEEEERLRKLKDEEEELKRLRELEEEEDRLRKLKEREETRKNPPAKTLGSNGKYRRKRREGGSRRRVNPDARPSRGGANIEAQVVANGGSGDRRSSSGANVEVEVALGNRRSVVEAPTIEELGKKKKKKGKSKNRGKQKEKMAEMPLAFNGSDEGQKGASGSGQMVTDIQKRVSDLKMGGRNRNPSRWRRPYWGARSGKGGGGVMMWVKKTMTEA